MTPFAARAPRRRPGLISLGVLAFAGLAGLFGCAAPGTGADPASRSSDIVTASDESDSRRRARIRLELASSYFDQGQTTVALDESKQALAADPNFADAYNLRGLIYMRLGDPKLAEENFRRAQQLNPRDASTQHNFGWLLCQQQRYVEANALFAQAAANLTYAGRAQSLMAQGLCEARAGQPAVAERLLAQAYEIDPGNPIIAYNLAQLLERRGELTRAQFYIRRLNNGQFANAETLWLGVRVERQLKDRVAMQQLGDQLVKRFGGSREAGLYQRGAFDD